MENILRNSDIYIKNDDDNGETDKEEEKDFSPSQRLLKSRKVIISDSINSKMADKIIKQLLIMNEMDSEKSITVIINSPGGEMYSGFGIFDMIRLIEAPVYTVVCGLAASMGSIISFAVPKERRYATPNSKMMIHQPLLSGLMGGTIADIEIEAAEMMKVKQKVVDIYVEGTGKTEEEIRKLIERNSWMTAEEALEFGHISKIINSFKELDLD